MPGCGGAARTATSGGVRVRTRHAIMAGRLAPLHEDPFDRMLVAPAQVEGLAVVSADPVFEGYGVSVLEA